MRSSSYLFGLGALAASSYAATNSSLASVCTTSYAEAALPENDVLPGITIDHSSVQAIVSYNQSFTAEYMYPNTVINVCNVTFSYSHNSTNDTINVSYWLPAPSQFENRFLTTGGGGYAINSGNTSVAGGIQYGAVGGITDGGFGGFDNSFNDVQPLANGTTNEDAIYSFGYQSIHEMTVIGQAFTKNFYSVSSDEKLYSYYQACSEGGREGWSQIQRFANQFDGAIVGAPAFRFALQQIQHCWSNLKEIEVGYYPPPCEMQMIDNLTISYCDDFDGKSDGVVARTDLCKIYLADGGWEKMIGTSYYCAAETEMGSTTPVQNGTITAKAVEIAKAANDGFFDSKGNRVYFSYQPTSTYSDAETTYNSETGEWELSIDGICGEYIQILLEINEATNIPSYDGITTDTLAQWAYYGMQKYYDVLETTWPDLTAFHESGAKILHFHGESDYSIPTASSVRYHNSVREMMYPKLGFNESMAALSEWYKLYLVPGAGHCAPNSYEANGPWPQTNLAVMIDWVEKGHAPTTLNGTILLSETEEGANQQICEWPLRPHWTSNSTADPECVYPSQEALDTWYYDLDFSKFPIY